MLRSVALCALALLWPSFFVAFAQPSPAPQGAQGPLLVVTYDDLPVSSTESRDSDVITKLTRGTEMEVLEEAADPIDNRIRARIRSGSTDGWITVRTLKPNTMEPFRVFAKAVNDPNSAGIEADTGDPKPGEGQGGVAVLLKPMPEATTMKTWSFLKESMLKIGDQVQQIMSVRDDMALLQKDLTTQEKLWHQAEIQLNQENAKVRAEVEQLKAEVRAGAIVKRELMKAQQALEEEQRRATDLQNQAEMDEKKWQQEVQYLDARKDNVTSLHRQVNETASREISRVEAVHLQLQKDAVTLRLAIGEFQDRMKNGQEMKDFENDKSLTRQAELKRQIAAMEEGLKRIHGKLKPRHIFDQQELALKQQLKSATDTILALQAEHQQIVAECMKAMQESDQIKCSEGAKFRSRLAEKTQFCNAVQVQNQVLKQDLAKCGGLAGIVGGTLPQPGPPVPAGLAPVLQPGDPEREMPMPPAAFAPAPATAFY